MSLSRFRKEICDLSHADEDLCVASLLKQIKHPLEDLEFAVELIQISRQQKVKGGLDAFLLEFGLSNTEGVALMCLAEALLRIPDAATADELIAEKLLQGNWQQHLGHSESLFVNASSWGLLLTGKFIRFEYSQENWVQKLLARLGEPVLREAMLQAMRIMAKQYVLGADIQRAHARSRTYYPPNTRFSFDMLGEAARTQTDAQRFFESYRQAINYIGENNTEVDPHNANGISIKLSALHPRYEVNQRTRVLEELYPRLLELAQLAHHFNLGFNIDAEESERLEISLDLFSRLANEPTLSNWRGLGFVLQAYQKRAPKVAEYLIALAKQTQRHFMIRLVKGAYWDREIKYAQENGYEDYPVFTRKVNTDLSYLLCAQLLLAEQDAIFPQFATHNAHTLASIYQLAKGKNFEFQRLHGMGDILYETFLKEHDVPIRVYAPVGIHKDLLPYLVRRLLENGANSSFVNRFLDKKTPANQLVFNVEEKVKTNKKNSSYRHPSIPLPKFLYKDAQFPRLNSIGVDLNNDTVSLDLLDAISAYNPDQVVLMEENLDVDACIRKSRDSFNIWKRTPIEKRVEIIELFANTLQTKQRDFIALICHEGKRTVKDAVSELREAIDFCRYYSSSARKCFSLALDLESPTGESNQLHYFGRGPMVCISPWNFPLAIFVGQIVAALICGNTVLAKPAEQTPKIASLATEVMHACGLPKDVLQLVIGDAEVGKQLVANENIAGVIFTGSSQAAKHIQHALALHKGPIKPLIAETGGVNTMIVDSSALLEQVCDDVIQSAFSSAGQRCSALRVLFVQNDIADSLIEMLQGACAELQLGSPMNLSSDIGPVIDKEALEKIHHHIEKMKTDASCLFSWPLDQTPVSDTYVGPYIFELKTLSQMSEEIFGPILHLIRFKATELPNILEDINNSQFGLTLGIHSRISGRAQQIFEKVNIGNVYVNRNMIGAVVGVNPFGGMGLSGTGPKAGGPHYLEHLMVEKTLTVNTVATGGNVKLLQDLKED